MRAASLGNEVVFLISQPRAGSTMLQRMLGSHPEIHTLSEPWLMLHPLYALRKQGVNVEFSHNTRLLALQDFLNEIANGQKPEEVYFEGIRRMYGYLYRRALQNSGKRFFLDKTPRYYHIIPDLYHTFPEAKYIILLRNPLAVLNSIMKTWVQGDWFSFSNAARRRDLLSAPPLLLEGIKVLESQCCVVRYEEVVTSPDKELRGICEFLDIEFCPDMIEYGTETGDRWQFGDQTNVYSLAKPDPERAHKWTEEINGPQTWRLLYDYLMLLGKETMDQLGYSYERYRDNLEQQQPSGFTSKLTLPLKFLLKPNSERRFAERNLVRVLKKTRLLPRS